MPKHTSEMMTYIDEVTGLEVCQLTSGESNDYHMYFTDNSFTADDASIYFISDRGSPTGNVYNLFVMDLNTGTMEQVTHEKGGIRSCTKSAEGEYLVYVTGNQLKACNTRTGTTDVIFEVGPDRRLDHPFISPDKKRVGVPCNEATDVVRGANYAGFKESMYAIKKSWIVMADIDGKSSKEVYEDTHWMGHFQFAPDDPNTAMFCHEGPWNLVHQRIWLLDTRTGASRPCFRQGEGDCVGHEFWTRDGQIFFDNRRSGHDGTITSDKQQATIEKACSTERPYVGLADKDGVVVRTIDMPYYCNHYHANRENSFLVGDENDNLVAIEIGSDIPKLVTMCNHATSWRTQRTHCHPTFSWNDKRVLFTSDRDGSCNLYLFDFNQIS